MTTEDLLINDGSHREAIEAVCECLPQTNVVTTLALIVKPMNAVDTGTLMVPSQQEEVHRILDLVR